MLRRRTARALPLLFAAAMLIAAPALAAPSADAGWLALAQKLAPAGTPTDFTPHGTQPGLTYDILTPEPSCTTCHAVGGGETGNPTVFRPFPTWAGSMMANATRDPLFWAALDIANHDVPGSGDFCLRCHTPRGWLMGNVVKPGFNPPGDPVQGAAGCLLTGAYDAPDTINSDFGGVTCHFCHRMMPEGPSGEPAYTENADAWIDDQNCDSGGGPCRRGPFDYADGDPRPPHPWKYSEFHTESALCGTCHNVSSPDTDAGPLKTLKLADGTDTALPFPIERTFSEWQQSAFSDPTGKTCQNCHMPATEEPDATACSLGGYPDRSGTLPVHAFVGGNTWVPAIIKGEYAQAIFDNGGLDRSASYDQTIAWARELLATAADMDATIAKYTPPGSGNGAMALAVKVTNESGHKLPTGYAEGRRMWINVEVKDANGALVFQSGAYDANTGVLTVDPQARVYEVLQGIWNQGGAGACDVADADGDPMFHFVLNDCIAKDNRIPPLGFRPATAADPDGYELQPVGATYPETSPGSGELVNFDAVTYVIPVPDGTAEPLTATARLYYQTSSREYIEFLRDAAVDNGTPAENTLCMGAPSRPFAAGPQDQSRGAYVYGLWNGGAPEDRVFADGFDGAQATGYGKSPPELLQVASATTGAKKK
jgi:hypothetical protein